MRVPMPTFQAVHALLAPVTAKRVMQGQQLVPQGWAYCVMDGVERAWGPTNSVVALESTSWRCACHVLVGD